MEFETIACPLCEEMRCTPQIAAPDRFNLQSEIRHHIVACARCGFVFLNPRPKIDAIAEAYKDAAYQPFLSAHSQRRVWDRLYELARRLHVRRKRRNIEQLKPKGKILDVGCGTGEFLNEMQRRGWQAFGVETNQQAAEHAKSRYGLPVTTCDLIAADFREATFDVVTFWHVLEHVVNPVQTLKTAKRFLKDDGVIVIACPNIESYDARFYRDHWVALDAPRHLSHFVPATMANACEQAGLEVLTFHQIWLDVVYNCLMSESIAAANKNVLARVVWLRALPLAAAFVLASAFNKQRGSSILYYLKKRVR